MRYRVEIFLNALQYLTGFAFAKRLYEPRFCIATLFTAVTRLTGRQDVGRNRTGTIVRCQRYEMIRSHACMRQQALLITTVSTAFAPICQAFMPLFVCQRVGQGQFSCITALLAGSFDIAKSVAVATSLLFYSVTVVLSIPLLIAPPLFRVFSGIPFAIVFAHAVRVIGAILAGSLAHLLRIGGVLLAFVCRYFCGVHLSVLSHLRLYLSGLSAVTRFARAGFAIFAPAVQAINRLTAFREILGRGEKIAFALRTTPKHVGDVQHLAPQLCWLNMIVGSPAVLSAACPPSGKATMLNYTTLQVQRQIDALAQRPDQLPQGDQPGQMMPPQQRQQIPERVA